MAGVAVKKGVSQPQNGFVDGIIGFTTEATTFNIDVSTLYPNVRSILHADVSVNQNTAMIATSPAVSWATTSAVVKVSVSSAQTTSAMSLRFVGQ